MIRPGVVLAALAVVGLTLTLSELRWFSRVPRVDRLLPYQPGAHVSRRSGVLSVASFREVVGPLCGLIGDRLARSFGTNESAETKLTRVHASMDVTAFRIRQVGSAAGAMAVALVTSLWFTTGPVMSMLAIAGAPVCAFLIHEMRLSGASSRWQQRIFLELPVTTEQLGMLVSAGWSLPGAISRIADRGSGACARDLGRVRYRMRQGLSEVDALREWADLADVPELTSLVEVLSLNRETADLGHLVAEETRGTRREAQRRLIEAIERRNQQVWIPVTVAALAPGVLLMAVPFVDALSLFST